MHRIDGAGNVNNLFVAEDTATNRPPTEFTPEWFNAAQEELATFIEWAGLVLAKGDNTQLRKGLLAKFALLESPQFAGTPTAPTAAVGTNTTQLATAAFVQAAITALVASSPAALDTLNELAAALGDDPNFATTITNALALKAPLASPALTGSPTAPTQAANDNTTKLATTAFVAAAIGRPGHTYTENDWAPIGGGLILQWGTITYPSGVSSYSVSTLPIAFPNVGLAAIISDVSLSTSNAVVWSVGSLAKTSITAYWNPSGLAAGGTSSRTGYFFALGR